MVHISEGVHSFCITCIVVDWDPWVIVMVAMRALPLLLGVAVVVTVEAAPDPAPVVSDKLNHDWSEVAVQESLIALKLTIVKVWEPPSCG